MNSIILQSVANPLLRFQWFETALSNFSSIKSGSGLVERRECWGDKFSDKTFYVVRRPNNWGLMSIYVMYLRYFDYAVRRGWIPVVDMQTASNLYLDEGRSYNAWESFFEQPFGYNLEDIRQAHNIVLSGQFVILADDYLIDFGCLTNARKLEKWRSLASRYMRLCSQAEEYVGAARLALLSNRRTEDRVLGIYCRGTDYLTLKPKNHPIQPQPSEVIDKARVIMKKHDYNFVYLVTEDEDILSQFLAAFGDKLIYLDVKRYISSSDYIWKDDEMLMRSRVKNGLEYLASIKLLSECDAFIGGVTGGSSAAMLMRDRPFEYTYLWNLGRYK